MIGCQVDLYGAGGDDRLIEVADHEIGVGPCHPQRARMYGGRGADYLRGLFGDDRLIGGAGRDVAFGAGGNDRCEAEKRTKCER